MKSVPSKTHDSFTLQIRTQTHDSFTLQILTQTPDNFTLQILTKIRSKPSCVQAKLGQNHPVFRLHHFVIPDLQAHLNDYPHHSTIHKAEVCVIREHFLASNLPIFCYGISANTRPQNNRGTCCNPLYGLLQFQILPLVYPRYSWFHWISVCISLVSFAILILRMLVSFQSTNSASMFPYTRSPKLIK